MSETRPAAWIALMKIGARFGCHQKQERSFFYKGCQFPVCARCAGLFFGNLAGLITSIIFSKFDYFNIRIYYHIAFAAFFILLLAIDGFGQLKGKWMSNNARRLATGLLCGFGAVSLAARAAIILFESLV